MRWINSFAPSRPAIRRMYDQGNDQAQRIHNEMALAARDFLARIEATIPPFPPGGRRGLAARFTAYLFAEAIMNFLPSTIQPEAAVVKMHRSPGRKVMRQVTPRATGAIHIENRVEHFAQVDGSRPSAPLRGRYERRDQSPLRIRQESYESKLWIAF